MRRYPVRFTEEAEKDLLRLYDFLLANDPGAADRSLRAIRKGVQLLGFSPYTCRRAGAGRSGLRELLIPFGASGYVVLFEI